MKKPPCPVSEPEAFREWAAEKNRQYELSRGAYRVVNPDLTREDLLRMEMTSEKGPTNV